MAEGATKKRRRVGTIVVSRLTLTIVLANLIGLVILLLGSFGVTAYRDGLVAAKLEGVRAQAQIIADVMAQTSLIGEECVSDTTSQGVIGEICGPKLEPEFVKDVFTNLWDSFEGRVRIYKVPLGANGTEIENAADLMIEDVVLRQDTIIVTPLAPIDGATPNNLRDLWQSLREKAKAILSAQYRREALNRTIEQELNRALASSPFVSERGASSVRIDENGELVASVSVPIRQVQAIHGVVTSEIGGIDDLVSEARLAILPFFGLAIAAAILSSLLLTAAIAQPIRQLALASDKVREGITAAGRARIPDFSDRKDEIGELSEALRSMTQAIYARIEAIESFAADVSHELKNPLTSIRSATETLEIAKKPDAREKLMGVIKKDVARMDRLITDISNASRLDAELAREARDAIDLRKLINDIVEMYMATTKQDQAPLVYDPSGAPIYLFGNASALGQVFRNLIDNARSFSPPDGDVSLSVFEGEDQMQVFVDDAGPGIPDGTLEKIFTRFYTKRPSGSAFGNNSGLGLAISRQIIRAHGGELHAENREQGGARFIIDLPKA